jgi:hypothetical protein
MSVFSSRAKLKIGLKPQSDATELITRVGSSPSPSMGAPFGRPVGKAAMSWLVGGHARRTAWPQARKRRMLKLTAATGVCWESA